MTTEPTKDDETSKPPLRTWKEIAAFLGSIGGPSSERQARNLVARGIPVYQASERGQVVAWRHEVRLWWRSRLRHVGLRPVAGRCRSVPTGPMRRAKTASAAP